MLALMSLLPWAHAPFTACLENKSVPVEGILRAILSIVAEQTWKTGLRAKSQ
jgi:hypothetical protein